MGRAQFEQTVALAPLHDTQSVSEFCSILWGENSPAEAGHSSFVLNPQEASFSAPINVFPYIGGP